MYRSSDDHLDKLFMCILEHGEHVAHSAAARNSCTSRKQQLMSVQLEAKEQELRAVMAQARALTSQSAYTALP